MNTSIRRILLCLGLALLILVAARFFDNPKTQALIPIYLSGASNLESGRGWLYTEADIVRFFEIRDPEARARLRLPPSPDAVPFDLAAKGFVYVIYLARHVFFWQGDLSAAESLQILVHILMTLGILSMLRTSLSRILFLLLYGLNPLILYVVTFPFYYFWQAVPSAFVAAYLLDRKLRFGGWTLPLAGLLAATYVVRPTALLVSVLLFGLIAARETLWLGAVGLATYLVLGMVVFGGNEHRTDPWHTAYIGIGAYPNRYLKEFSDKPGHQLYEDAYGEPISKRPFGNYRRPGVLEKLVALNKKAYLEILKESPGMLLRNAVLNFLQSFSVGYFTASLILSYLSSLLGLCFLALLLVRGKLLLALAIAVTGLSFTPYYPPIPVYLFGSYVLLVAAFVDVVRCAPLVERWSARLDRLGSDRPALPSAG